MGIFQQKYETNHEDRVTLPEKDLWIAVLSRAILDACKGPPELDMTRPANIPHKNLYGYNRQAARHFFLTGGKHFKEICEMAGRNPTYVRAKIRKKILSAAIYMNAKEDTKIYKEIIKDILCVAPEYGKKIARMIFKKDLKCGNIFMQAEEDPNENNKIVLDKEKDEFGIPMVKLFYKKSEYSLKTAKLFLEEFANLCRKEDLGRIAIKESIYNLEDIEELLLGAHHIGGTRMGLDKFDSVINKDLKVHDINNLYISGSSSFVTSGYTNPTFTIIQFALRLADEINKRLYSSII